MRNAVAKDGSHPALLKAAKHGISMLRGILDMRPVKEGRNARIQGLKGSNERANIGIFGSIDRTKFRENTTRVITKVAIGGKLFERAFPGMSMGINQAWHHDHPTRVNHGTLRDFHIGLNGANKRTFYEDISTRKGAKFFVSCNDRAVLNHKSLRHQRSSFFKECPPKRT